VSEPLARDPVVALVSFEGPDGYSMAGGLGQRVTTLATALAQAGLESHLFFLGDPRLPGEEGGASGRPWLHRWAQWVSAHHPGGVYQGEEDKRRELTDSLPPRLVALAGEAVRRGRPYAFLFEDWQCAEAALRTSRLLAAAGLRDQGWVAHNTNTLMGVERARLWELQGEVRLTTVSRFMKHALWRHGVNPVTVPNGLPEEAFTPPSAAAREAVRRLRRDGRLVLVKLARFDPDKAWHAAAEAVARLRHDGLRPLLVMRGGMEGYGHEVMAGIARLGLRVREGAGDRLPEPEEVADCEVWRAISRIPDDLVRGLYAEADMILAQSAVEPFGLVGIEAMAQGGLVMVGATGEDYARHRRNALVAELGSAAEVAHLVRQALAGEHLGAMRRAARATARQYRWRRLLPELLERLAEEG
jgi:glycosyltransferase involved in cell wall biosynthesis